jgi:LAO/AO transport system kinase
MSVIDAALGGDRRSLARLISLVEDDRPGASEALAELFPRTGGSYVIGMTGAPGAGKSTLTSKMITTMRQADLTVAVLAVDPSSPFTGGAILGDRIRMQDHASDSGVYIRSMGSRGHLGGVSEATPKGLIVLDAMGFPYVIVETVGVGQAEVEIVESADTTIVVLNPGWGDSVQANKAGLLEIGDLFVVNKADRPGVSETIRDLNQMLDLGGERSWRPPVLPTVATTGEGIGAVWDAIQEHRAFLDRTGELEERRMKRLGGELKQAIATELAKRADAESGAGEFSRVLADVTSRQVDPWTAARQLLS